MVQVPILIPQIVGKPNFQRLHLQETQTSFFHYLQSTCLRNLNGLKENIFVNDQ